jgi:hypothetical protein
MIENIIGDKAVFAIQYSISDDHYCLPYAYGDCLIWLGGNFLGEIEGEVYLTRVGKILQSVYLMTDKLTLPEGMYELPDSEKFKVMEENWAYWFMDTEGFDSISKYVYHQNDVLYFLWELRSEVSNILKIGDSSRQLFSAKVPISIYTEVTNEFRDRLVSLNYL